MFCCTSCSCLCTAFRVLCSGTGPGMPSMHQQQHQCSCRKILICWQLHWRPRESAVTSLWWWVARAVVQCASNCWSCCTFIWSHCVAARSCDLRTLQTILCAQLLCAHPKPTANQSFTHQHKAILYHHLSCSLLRRMQPQQCMHTVGGHVPPFCVMQAYDSGDGMMAARLWWILTVAGHPAAHVLEGGW